MLGCVRVRSFALELAIECSLSLVGLCIALLLMSREQKLDLATECRHLAENLLEHAHVGRHGDTENDGATRVQ